MSVPSPGDYIPQTGFTADAQVILQGDPLTPQPNSLTPIPPRLTGRTPNGRPWFQGKYQIDLVWNSPTVDEFQRLSVMFSTILNNTDGPLITILYPDLYRAGQYVQQTGFMEWPTVSRWENGTIQSVSIHISELTDV